MEHLLFTRHFTKDFKIFICNVHTKSVCESVSAPLYKWSWNAEPWFELMMTLKHVSFPLIIVLSAQQLDGWFDQSCTMIHAAFSVFTYTWWAVVLLAPLCGWGWASPLAQWWRIHLQCRRHGFDPCVGKIPWRRKWQPAPIFSPGKSHGQRSPAGYRPWSHKRVGHDLVTKQKQWMRAIESKAPYCLHS